MTANSIREYVDAHAGEFFEELKDWLRIPSMSGDPASAPDVRRSAEWLADALRRTGFPTVEIWETENGGHPAVFAEWAAENADAPTVVVYGHHDVQPVDPLELWDSPPFEPVERGDLLLGRGGADDKGQVYFHTLGLRANLAASGRTAPPVNLKLIIEGEEESGSPNFPALLRAQRERLRCDVVVVSDTGMWSREVPTICTGMRGMVSCEIELHGPAGDLHSGSFGGAVPNPLHAMVDLLAGLHDKSGRVMLDGFYDSIIPLTDRERELFARLPFDEAEWLGTAQSTATYGEEGYTTLERIWARPTAEINGMWGGYQGPGSKTIVPSAAHAKVSFRLVAGQEPAAVIEAMRRYVEAATPEGITSKVHAFGDGVRPCLTPLDDPALQAVRRSMEKAFGTEVLNTREGGSGPEADLAEILEAPVVFLGVGLPTDRIHAPNENVVMPLLLKGAEAAAYLWDDLAEALR
jgi:acetylornithine deacetylase/succinyl-diaminopimelate desuccinylase-like protein